MIESILIVDDKPQDRSLIAMVLQEAGYKNKFIEAASGKQGLKMVVEHQPDFVVLDMQLPDMNGLDVCKLIKQEHPETKVAMITGMFEKIDPVKAIESQSDEFIAKVESAEALREIFQKFNE